MPDVRRVRSLGVAAPGRTAVFNLDETGPADGDVWVTTRWSGISAGTELSFVKATNPFLHRAFDPETRVFSDGEPRDRLPLRAMGYMEVGEVAESRTAGLSVGTLVAAAYGHKTSARAGAGDVVALPDDLDPLLGIYVAQMGPICANGLLHAAADAAGDSVDHLDAGVRGRNVLVTGAGVVGLLTALFACHLGAANVVIADATPQRLAAAAGLGLEIVDLRAGPAWQVCTDRWRHERGDAGADVVFQCRGRTSALEDALKAVRRQGTVIDLAFYQGGADDVRLGEEFHHKGLTIRCAQIGCVPRGLGDRWDRRRLSDATLDLLRTHGSHVRRHMISDVVPFDAAGALLEDLAARRRHTLQTVIAF